MEKSETQVIRAALENTVVPLIREGGKRAVPSGEAYRKSQSAYFELKVHPMASHDYFEWWWLLSGTAQIKLNDVIYEMRKGDFCLLPPLYRHCDVYDRDTPPYQSLWFAYFPGVLECNLLSYEPIGKWQTRGGRIAGAPAIATVLSLLKAEILSDSPRREGALQSLLLYLSELLLRALENNIQHTASPAHGRVASRVVDYLTQHYGEQITLEEIARVMHLNPNHLATVFKKETGQTIFGVLKQMRMERAGQLILEGNLPLSEIASQVGYNSLDRFSRNFRDFMGLPPSRYGSL